MKLHYPNPYPDPADILPNDKFISIVITTYSRPFYLKRAIQTLHQHADMPFELIINDDGSDQKSREELFAMSEGISTIIFNNGKNMGLNEAANRAIKIASSKYVLFTTDDCWFTKPTLRDVCNVLQHDYVGSICAASDIGELSGPVCNTNGTRWSLSNNLGGGITQAFRKDVWKEVGGWDLRSTSGQSDNVFLFKMYKAGYWKGVMEGYARVKCANFDEADTYKPTFDLMQGRDCSFPKIFGIPEDKLLLLGHLRREACQYWVDGERTIDEGNGRGFYDTRPNPIAGLNDIPYWANYFMDCFNGVRTNDLSNVNWDACELHGQSKWKDQIVKDFNLQG